MKQICCALALALGITMAEAADDQTISLDDVVRSAQQWANENIDPQALHSLTRANQDKVNQFFNEIRKQLRGEYVVDLAPLKDAARNILPILDSSEDTVPYAAWLRSELDYLDVADHFLLIIPAPKPKSGSKPLPIANPSAEQERKTWTQELSQRPWPAAARQYVPRLKPIFTSENVPPELVWVAEVESSFDPRARSLQGATGLFQLMPETARRYGISPHLPDQRADPEHSARVAARYLHFLHSHFGSWPLALAAYNSGEGTVDKLLERYKTRSFDRIATHLPAETQMFVPRVEATVNKREGLKLD